MSKVTLVIIFNHKYNNNIPIIYDIYRKRFEDIVFVVPFYRDEEMDNKMYEIIGVYDSSYSFEGYIAQAYYRLKEHNSKSYLFIGDDLVLHPRIDENNFKNYFNIDEGDSYNTEICKINEPFGRYKWNYSRIYQSFMCFTSNRFVNYREEIPTKEQALDIAKNKGYVDFKIKKHFYLSDAGIRGHIRSFILRCKTIPREAEYPLFGGYSDLCIVSGDDLQQFSHMLGVFSSMGLFVEVAIPTAMILTCKSIKQQQDTRFERGDIWGMDSKQALGKKYGYSLERLFKEWPENLLFIHPIKLSQWKQ